MARDNYVISGDSARNAEMNVQAQVRISETLGMNRLVDIEKNMYMYRKKTRGQGQKICSNSWSAYLIYLETMSFNQKTIFVLNSEISLFFEIRIIK